MVVEKSSDLLIQERHNYLQAIEEDKSRFPVRLEKKPAFASLKKYVTSYAMLQILSQVNILKECQLKGETLPPCANSFRRSMGLPCAHILERRVLENRGLLQNDLASHWLFYRARPSRDTEINDPVWEDWPENIPRRPDFHYVDPQTTPILGPVVHRAPLEANLSVQTPLASPSALELPFPINTPRPVSPYQLDTMPEVDIPQATPNRESETASSALSSPPFLSTPLSVRSRVLRPELGSHTDYNHEFQPEINPLLEIKSPSQIKTKGRPPGAKNKKRSSAEPELGESSTRRDPSRFEHEAGQIPQVGVENGRASRANRGGRVDGADRGGRVGRADRGGRVNKTAGRRRVGRASRIDRVGRTRGEGNRSVTINRTRAEEAGTIETEAVGVVETTSEGR